MTTLIRYELRRVWPIGLVLLASAALFGGLDVALNARRAQCPGISLYYCALLAVVLAFGAAAFARTGRDRDSRFLSLWPVSRGAAALVRVLLYLLLAALGIVFAFVLCGAVLSLGGRDPWDLLFREVLYQPWSLPGGLAVLALGFGFGLLWTQLTETAVAVPLVAVSGAALTAGLSWLILSFVPTRFGPWMSPAIGDALAHSDLSPLLVVKIAVALAALALAAALIGAVRAPLLETKRRAAVSFGALGLLLATLAVIALPFVFPLRQPPPQWLSEATAQRAGVLYSEDIILDESGRRGLIQSTGPGAALWTLDLRTGQLRRLTRGQPDIVELTASGNLATFEVYGHGWVADLNTGRLRHLQTLGPTVTTLSPTGRYRVAIGQNGQTIVTDGRAVIPLGLSEMLLGWQGEAALFTMSSDPNHVVRRVSLPDGAARVIATKVPITPWERNLSPGGRWVVGRVFKPHTKRQLRFGLLDTTTGQYRELPGQKTDLWSADERYLWTADNWWGSPHGLRVLDTQTMKLGPPIGPAQLDGNIPSLPFTDPQRQRVYFRARPLQHPGDAYWTADITGGHLRKVGDIHAALWGVSAEGQLVMHDNQTLFLFDPRTREHKVLLTLGKP